MNNAGVAWLRRERRSVVVVTIAPFSSIGKEEIPAIGPLSDRYGRKGLVVAGVQALGLFLTAASHGFGW